MNHNMTNTRIYRIYHGMKQRCNNPKSKAYKHYGARGISVCEEWLGEEGFIRFNEWAMQNGYSENLSIDRFDNDKGYSPDNCRWTTTYEQQRNKRNNLKAMYDGKEMVVADISKCTGIKNETLRYRYKNNKDLDVSEPKHRIVNHNGKQVSLRELSEITGINYNTLQTRKTKGYNDKQIASPYMSEIKKRVAQYDKQGNLIRIYDGTREAARITGFAYSGIASVCSGKRKSCRGYIWKHVDKENPRIEVYLEEVE